MTTTLDDVAGINQQIARTILDQLGGGRFMAMTGAKDFVYGEGGVLTFRIPRAKDGINRVKITLSPLDLYDLEFLVVAGIRTRTASVSTSVYAEDLQRVFTAHTGLATRL